MHSGDLRPALELAKTAPEDADSVVTEDGKRYGLRQLGPGIELSAESGEWSRVLWFPPVENRPSGLPDEIPFLPGLETTVTIRLGKFLTQWALPDVDPGATADAVYKRMQMAGLDPSKRNRAFRSLAPTPDTVNRLDGVLLGLCKELEGDGWKVSDAETREVPFPMKRMILVRDERTRELARGAIFGLPAITMRDVT